MEINISSPFIIMRVTKSVLFIAFFSFFRIQNLVTPQFLVFAPENTVPRDRTLAPLQYDDPL